MGLLIFIPIALPGCEPFGPLIATELWRWRLFPGEGFCGNHVTWALCVSHPNPSHYKRGRSFLFNGLSGWFQFHHTCCPHRPEKRNQGNGWVYHPWSG
jgi:hypothetical protein